MIRFGWVPDSCLSDLINEGQDDVISKKSVDILKQAVSGVAYQA